MSLYSEIRGGGVAVAPHAQAAQSAADVLAEADIDAVHQYIRARASEDRAAALDEKKTARLTWLSAPVKTTVNE